MRGSLGSLVIVCSSGGHLLQMLELREAWEPFSRVWVTFDKADTRSLLCDERVIHAYGADEPQRPQPPAQPAARRGGHPPRAAVGDPDHGRRRRRPVRLAGPRRGVPTVYVESVTRMEELSLSARLIAPVARRTYVQWPELVAARRAPAVRGQPAGRHMILVTVGTNEQPFDRLVEAAAELDAGEGLSSSTAPRRSRTARGPGWTSSPSRSSRSACATRASSSATRASARSCSRTGRASGPIVVPRLLRLGRGRRRPSAPARAPAARARDRDARRGHRAAGRGDRRRAPRGAVAHGRGRHAGRRGAGRRALAPARRPRRVAGRAPGRADRRAAADALLADTPVRPARAPLPDHATLAAGPAGSAGTQPRSRARPGELDRPRSCAPGGGPRSRPDRRNETAVLAHATASTCASPVPPGRAARSRRWMTPTCASPVGAHRAARCCAPAGPDGGAMIRPRMRDRLPHCRRSSGRSSERATRIIATSPGSTAAVGHSAAR